MKVILLDWGQCGKEMASLAWKVMQEDIDGDIGKFMAGETIDTSKFNALKKESLGTPLEFIPMVWYISGVTRAFTHQLVRHRVGWSYSQQSMRVVPKERFFEKGLFLTPGNVRHKKEYEGSMQMISNCYDILVSLGEDPEVARGLLPTNIHTTIMAATNYRAWRGLAIQRLCSRVQGEFHEVVLAMINEVRDKMGEDFADVKAPCEYDARCMIPSQWEKCKKARTADGREIIR